jgi:hypothetical protein
MPTPSRDSNRAGTPGKLTPNALAAGEFRSGAEGLSVNALVSRGLPLTCIPEDTWRHGRRRGLDPIFSPWGAPAIPDQARTERRARAKAEGARRIDVTLSAQALDDYATVRCYLERLNRIATERNIPMPPFRLSDTEVITAALRRAASAIEDDTA